MGSITALFVRKVAAQVDDRAVRDELLRSVGVDPASEVDPAERIGDDAYYDFFERVADVDADVASLPLRVGASMRCTDYGAFGLAFKSALDLRGSYRRAERYAQVLTSVSTYDVEEASAGSFMHLRREGARRLGMRLSNEASVASVFAISKEVSSRPLQPLGVYFRHPGPGSTAAHEAHFGCPVHFGSDRDALLVPTAALEVPNIVGDAGISRFFRTRLEAEVAELATDDQVAERVREEVSQSLSGGVPVVADVARRLGMSARTLQRRLADEGSTFQHLVDESRRQLAKRLLRDTDFSLVEIAYMTGYSEQSAFSRAFKRWAGHTPRSYRLGA